MHLSGHHFEWLESDITPSRIRAKQKADQEICELLETLTLSIGAIQSRNIEARLNGIRETYARLIAAAVHRVRDLDLPPDTTSAEIALMGVMREIERQQGSQRSRSIWKKWLGIRALSPNYLSAARGQLATRS